MPVRLVAATRSGIVVADEAELWRIETTLGGEDVRSLVVASPACRLYAGTQGNGVFRSEDTGATWSRAGLAGEIVKALAVGPDGAVYAGTKPPALFVSRDAGESWLELEGFRAMRRWYWRQPAERPHTHRMCRRWLSRRSGPARFSPASKRSECSGPTTAARVGSVFVEESPSTAMTSRSILQTAIESTRGPDLARRRAATPAGHGRARPLAWTGGT